MKRLLFFATALCSQAFAQDYKEGLTFKDGFTAIYRTTTNPGASMYTTTPATTTRYGLIDKNKQIVLPLKYKSVMYSYEPGIYMVKDTLDKTALYNAFTKNFITPSEFYEIETFGNGLAVVKKSNNFYGLSWGAVDNKGNLVIPVDYDYLGSYFDGLMNFKKDEKYGFVDRNNKVVIPNVYGNISNFFNGLAPVKEIASGKYGYIDKQNTMVIPAIYQDAEDFTDGYAMVKRKTGGRGGDDEVALINTKGKELTDFSYSFISARQPGGLFLAKQGKLYGLLDSTGKLVLPVSYPELTSTFNNNYKFMTAEKKYGLVNNKGKIVLEPQYQYISPIHGDKTLYMKKDGKFSVVDKNLKPLIPADSAESVLLGDKRIAYFHKDRARIFDANGKLLKTFMQPNLRTYGSDILAGEDTLKLSYDASVFLVNLATKSVKALPYNEVGDFNEEGIFVAKKDKHDFVDYTGKKLNATGYYAVVNFSDGICAVQESSTASPYLADKNFTKIKTLNSTFTGPYSEGLALCVGAFGALTYIDKTGNSVFSATGKNGGKCIDGHIQIVDNFSNYTYVDKSGKQIGKDSWKSAREFSEGLAAVQLNGKWGFIDGAGNYVIPAKYDEASSFGNGAAIAKSNGKFNLINKKGETIGSDSYEAAGNPDKGFFPLMKGGKVGLVDSKGITVIDFKYDNITPIYEDRLWATKGGKWALVDNKGKELTGFIYSSAGAFNGGYAYVASGEKVGVVDKTGKLVLPLEYKTVGSVYKNSMVAMKGAGTVKYSIR